MKQVVTALAAMFFSLGALAQEGVAERLGKAAFSVAEQETIRAYFDERPGLAKKMYDAVKEELGVAEGEAVEEDDREDDADELRKGKKDKKGKKEKGAKGNGKGKGLPPGLAKRDELPPGLARKLERDGQLPPGLAKRELPDDLESMLPDAPEGTERVVVGTDVVLVEQATGVVRDIIRDILKP